MCLAPQDAALQPAVFQLIEDVISEITALTNKPAITKDAFVEMMVTVINNSQRLKKMYTHQPDAVKAVLTREILDRVLMHLTRLGKVND